MSEYPAPGPATSRGSPASPAARSVGRRLLLLVLTLGAVLFAFAAWVPWWVYINLAPVASQEYQFSPGQASNVVPLRFLPPTWVHPAWSILSALAILLAGLLWIGGHPGFARVMLISTMLWATLMTVISGAFWRFVATGGYPPTPATHNIPHGLHAEYPAAGLWLALGALALVWIGVLALVGAQRRDRRAGQLW